MNETSVNGTISKRTEYSQNKRLNNERIFLFPNKLLSLRS